MNKIVSLNDILLQNPEISQKLGWIISSDGRKWENKNLGSVFEQHAVCTPEGKYIYDQPVITELGGAISVPYDVHDGIIRVGLQKQERHVSGKTFYEFPRGFKVSQESTQDAAIRETSEEIGLRSLKNIIYLGPLNSNTAFFRYASKEQAIGAYALEFSDIAKAKIPKQLTGKDEKIVSFDAYTLNDLQKFGEEGKLECGLTNAALCLFMLRYPAFYGGMK